MTAIDESTPRMKDSKRGWRKKVAWWNDELAGMRREVVAAKKQLARRRKWSCLVEAENDILPRWEHRMWRLSKVRRSALGKTSWSATA